MDRITDAWSGLSRRERVLAGGIAGAVALVLLVLLVVMGRDPAPVVGAMAGDTGPVPTPPVQAAPGTIVVNRVPDPVSAPGGGASGAAGVAPLSVADAAPEGGGGSTNAQDPKRVDAEANANWRPVPAKPKQFVPPRTSDAVKLAARDLEQVAKEYGDCVRTHPDTRPCMQVLKYGVYTKDNVLDDGHGIVLMKQSSDGHTLRFAITDGADCRMLDDAANCDAWRVG